MGWAWCALASVGLRSSATTEPIQKIPLQLVMSMVRICHLSPEVQAWWGMGVCKIWKDLWGMGGVCVYGEEFWGVEAVRNGRAVGYKEAVRYGAWRLGLWNRKVPCSTRYGSTVRYVGMKTGACDEWGAWGIEAVRYEGIMQYEGRCSMRGGVVWGYCEVWECGMVRLWGMGRATRCKWDLGLQLEISGKDACSDKKDPFPVPARLRHLERHFKQRTRHFWVVVEMDLGRELLWGYI